MAAASAVPTLPSLCAVSYRTRIVLKWPHFCGAASSRKACSRRPISSYALPEDAGAMSVPGRALGKPGRGFLPLGAEETRHRRHLRAYAGKDGASGASTVGFPNVIGLLHLVVSLGLILAADKFLKRAFVATSIKFPSALFGMFCVFTALMVLDSAIPSAAKALTDFFEPATLFIQRWLPLFYVPSLVVLPLAVRDIPTSAGLKICIIFRTAETAGHPFPEGVPLDHSSGSASLAAKRRHSGGLDIDAQPSSRLRVDTIPPRDGAPSTPPETRLQGQFSPGLANISPTDVPVADTSCDLGFDLEDLDQPLGDFPPVDVAAQQGEDRPSLTFATELAASTAELAKLISSGTAPELPAYDVDLGISVGAPGVLSSTVGVYHTGVPGFAPDLLPPVGGPAEEEERDIVGVLPPVGRPVEEEERDIADAGSTVLASQIEGESLGAVSKDLSAASQEIELPKVTASEAPLRADGAPMPSNHVAPEVATCVASEVPLVGGWLASLCVAAYATLTVRNIVKTEMISAEPMAKPSPFSSTEVWTWTAVFISSFIFALVSPTALGTSARTSLPFLLAATVLGYMVGSGLPSDIKKVFHPIICCALSADLAAVAFGYFSRSGMDAVLGDYLTKASSNPGAGDILMGFLGSVIISFAFSMFKQRKLVNRHAAEIFSSVVISTIFSLYSTAILGRFIGLEPTLTISILPRCITVALALSIVSFFEGANTSLTAAVVVLTGLVGANFVQAVLDKLGFKDPIARGIATASSAHGLGTAALSAKEPEALPFCAIAYALTGIFGSLLCSVPAVRQSLLAIVG